MMKLQLQRETLLEPLQRVMGVVEKKQTLPILSNVLLKAQQNTLSITGTDLEVEVIGQSALHADTETDQITLTIRRPDPRRHILLIILKARQAKINNL